MHHDMRYFAANHSVEIVDTTNVVVKHLSRARKQAVTAVKSARATLDRMNKHA